MVCKENPVNLPLFTQAHQHLDRIAIVSSEGRFTYQQLLSVSAQVAVNLLQEAQDLQEQRVAFLVPPGFDYVATQWGIWGAGGIAVPLCVVHPQPELEYVITDSGASIIIAHPEYESLVRPLATKLHLRFILTSEPLPTQVQELPPLDLSRRALILYTSGTTGKPKGVVTTHGTLQAQVTCLNQAWGWTASDRILNVLPLHHIHGIVNVLTCALWAGAKCHFLGKFAALKVWERIAQGDLTLFMAVPTIYAKLITAWEEADRERQESWSAACAKMRLLVSGSAALPVQILERWQSISGHFLLERYGMTEIGMALSNPLHGERRAGFVGKPLPSVTVRLVDEQGAAVPPGTPGEIQVQGPSVFLEYWGKPEATAKAFCEGWFRTGDLAVVEADNYRILGRISVDIIKTGGYKVSALEIENVLLTHPAIQECAVVGVQHREWGEQVCAAIVLKPECHLSLEALRTWTKARLAVYKVPQRLELVEALPRNTMGKLTKPAVAQLFS
jgi:malonyl-CoA/methylmalonyl-CoA synthetase